MVNEIRYDPKVYGPGEPLDERAGDDEPPLVATDDPAAQVLLP